MGVIFKKITSFVSLTKEALTGGEKDFTEGSIKKAIFLLSVPMILELSLESIFAIVDMYFVGKLGQNAIAVVGYTESMVTIIYSMAIGLSTGAAAIIARRVGEKEFKGASSSAAQALIISALVSLIMSVVGVVYADELLRFMGATDDVIAEGGSFTKIMFGSNIVIVFLFLINGIFRGAGNAALAMKSLWIASILNIVLDPILIYGLGPFEGWGLQGAAIATCIGRGTGVLYQLVHLFNGSSIIKLHMKDFKPDFKLIGAMTKLAWPATLQFILASGSWIVLTKLVADIGGTEASAGYQIAIRNIIFFILPAWGLSNAAATLIGQNLGAKKIERAEKSVLLATKYNAIFMSFVMAIFIFVSQPIVSFFSDNVDVIRIGVEALQIIGSGFIFYGIGMVLMQSLNGAGDTTTPTWINFVGFWVIQIPLAYFLAMNTSLQLKGAFWAVPISETLIAIAAYFIFKKGFWKDIKV